MAFYPKPLLRNIRAARKKAGLSQEQMAEALSLCALSYSKLERGVQPISLKRLAQIADILNTSVYALLDGSVPFSGPAVNSSAKASFADEIARLAASCPPEGQHLIHDIAQLIAGNYNL